jgi:hypothetical protein
MKRIFKLIFLAIIFLNISCQKKSEIKFNGTTSFTLKPDKLEVENIEIRKWRVGPLGRQLVSKGISFSVAFPQIERDDLEKMGKNFGVDSWLIKIKKRAYAQNTVLGYMYIPLIVPGTQAKNKYRRHQIKTGTFSVYYAAAAVSTRFEKMLCPAFDHNKLIEKTFLKPSPTSTTSFFAGAMEEKRILAKVEPYSYSGNTLNGGKELIGEYNVEVALFNYKDKTKKSNFVPVPQDIIIKDEELVSIRGCTNFKAPPPQEDIDKTQLFKWKRD